MYTTPIHKRHVRVILDIDCYNDLDLEDFNWRRLLELEGDEEVDYTIEEIDPFKGLGHFRDWHKDGGYLLQCVLCCLQVHKTPMFTYNANEVLLSLVIDSAHYEKTEEWDKHSNVMKLFTYIQQNSVNGIVYLTEEQRDVYLCGESRDYNADCYVTVGELAQRHLLGPSGRLTINLFTTPPTTMCGPAPKYSFQDFLNDASAEEWAEWEEKAAELELPVDYYVAEFV